MRYLLDANVVIRYLDGRVPNVRFKVDSTPTADLAVSSVVVAELRYGAAKSVDLLQAIAKQDQFLSTASLVPFDGMSAEVYGTLRASLERSGTPIGPNDMLIGATALAYNLILVTHNVREFARIQGLVIEDWEV